MSDFRQEVEKIIAWELDRFDGSPTRMRIFTDRICEAVLKMAEGMPEPECCKAGDKGLNNLVFLGAKEYRLTCQTFIRKELEASRD